jgi:general secretion pathway protein C
MNKVVWMIKWVLVLILVWTIGWAVSVFRQAGPVLGPATVMALDDLPQAQVQVDSVLIPVKATEVNYAAILEHDPFGGVEASAPSPQRPEVNEPSPLPIGEALGIALIGTVTGSPSVARAIVRERRTKATTVYKIGDRVNGAILEGVSRDSVVFLYQGREQVLRHPHDKTPSMPQTGTLSESPDGAGPAAPVVAQSPLIAQARSDTDSIQEFLDKATITPVLVDGQVQGLRITGLDRLPAARFLGLEEGDVICTVNGQGLTNPRKAFQIFKKAKAQEGLQIELIRKGRPQTLSFDLK